MSDPIERQAALDALTKDKKALEHIINGMSGYEKEFDRLVGQRNQVDYDIHAIEQLPPAQSGCEDAVPRTSIEYICEKNLVSTNPYEHKYHDKFIQFMNDPEISDFGRWEHSNGFNTALVAVRCDLDKILSVTPKQPGEDTRAMCGEYDAWNQYKNYPQLGWIPCSKKLPEPNQSVLVQLNDDFVDQIRIMTLDISKCEGDFFYFWRTQEMSINFDMDDVVAWIPLPTPWEGGQNNG